VTLAGSPRARDLAERETTGQAVPFSDPLAGSRTVAAARWQERESLSRYRSLILAARESLYKAEAHFSAASHAVDEHIHGALTAVAQRRAMGRPVAHQVTER
jgi:hypothetical protein